MVRVNNNLQFIEKYKPSDREVAEFAKLDWNECNLKFDDAYIQKLQDALKDINFTEYPNINNKGLLSKLAGYCGMSTDEIQIFNGSDSALNYIFSAFLNKDSRVLIYYPHYNQIETYIRLHTNDVTFSHIGDIFNDHIYDFNTVKDHDVIYLSNPNNPPGYYVESGEIEKLLIQYPDKLFIIDEAYYEFCKKSSCALATRYNNIIVCRTFSKAFSLASIRLGYICCSKELLHHINNIRNPKEVNSFAQILGATALDSLDYIGRRINTVIANMQYFKEGLDKLNIRYVDSQANFVLLKVEQVKEFIKALHEQKILVRDRTMFEGLDNCVRISIGELDEMKQILEVLSKHIRNIN